MAVVVHTGKHQRCNPEPEFALTSAESIQLYPWWCLTHSHPLSQPWPRFAIAMSAARGIQSWGGRWLAQVYISLGAKMFQKWLLWSKNWVWRCILVPKIACLALELIKKARHRLLKSSDPRVSDYFPTWQQDEGVTPLLFPCN